MKNLDGSITLSAMSPNDLKNLIQTGEGLYLEFKRTTPSPEKIAREIGAFANTRGGTILVGVDDDKTISGIRSWFEEEFLMEKAADEFCVPAVGITMEMVHLPDRDVMVVLVPESKQKPVYNRGKRIRQVFVRRGEESVLASGEQVEVLRKQTSQEGVSFEYGEKERLLFRYLNEYGEITVEGYSRLINATTHRASGILVNLVGAGVLSLSSRKNVDYFTFSHQMK
ncbi:MAG: ATP-binding protein [Balneolaceae bacterium]